MENVDDYITSLFNPILMNDSLSRLSAASLAEKIKGGGRGAADQPHAAPVNGTAAFGFTPIGTMGSPTPVMPGMMSPPPMMMPIFAPAGKFVLLQVCVFFYACMILMFAFAAFSQKGFFLFL